MKKELFIIRKSCCKKQYKNLATSKVKILESLRSLYIPSTADMRDDQYTTTSGIVILHSTKGTHWILFINQYYFDFTVVHP